MDAVAELAVAVAYRPADRVGAAVARKQGGMCVENPQARDAKRVDGDQQRERGADRNVGVQRGQQRPDPGGRSGHEHIEPGGRLLGDRAERVRTVAVAPERGREHADRLMAQPTKDRAQATHRPGDPRDQSDTHRVGPYPASAR